MSFKNCEVAGCKAKSLLDGCYCSPCKTRYCYDHREDPIGHPCLLKPFPKGVLFDREQEHEPEATTIISLINVSLVTAEVECLRPGRKCIDVHVPPPGDWQSMADRSGSYNYHIPIHFDDGVRWVMRIRRTQTREHPAHILSMNIDSEVATIQALAAGGAKVPKAWGRPSDSQLSPHLFYFYEEFVENHADAEDLLLAYSDVDDEARSLIDKLAAWYIDLEKVKFGQDQGVGCLTFNENGQAVIGPLISIHPHFNTPPYFLGPFATSKHRYLAEINLHLQQTVDKARYAPSRELPMYLALLEARELVRNCEEMDQGPWYIKHKDERGDQVRVSADGGIEGVIDWEWAYLTCKGDAYAAPSMLFLDNDYYNGKNDSLSEREQILVDAYRSHSRDDLATCVKAGRKFQRLRSLLDVQLPTVTSLNAMRRAFLNLADETEGYPATMQEWISAKEKQFSDDSGLALVLQRDMTRPILDVSPSWGVRGSWHST